MASEISEKIDKLAEKMRNVMSDGEFHTQCIYDKIVRLEKTIVAKIAALDEKIEALGQAKTAPVREEVPEAPGLGAFGHLPVLEQHRMQQRGGDY
jgi:hypothetical protein